MKKIIAICFSMVLCLGLLSACGSGGENVPVGSPDFDSGSGYSNPVDGPEGEITVFAAASLTESMDQIIAEFTKENPGIKVIANYGSSGTLMDQIKEGAYCDIFISAAQKQMNQIDISADPEINTDGSDFVVAGTRVDLLENQCVLAVPEGNPAGINSFDDLKAAFDRDGFLFAMGSESVPVGAYTQKIFAYLGLDEAALANAGKITYGEDVKGVTSAVSEATAQAGVIYGSDAYSAGLDAVAVASEEMTGGKVIYPAALIKTSTAQNIAGLFLDYLQGETATSIFESVGFKALTK